MTHGGCLGAPADSVDSIAKKTIAGRTAARSASGSKYQPRPTSTTCTKSKSNRLQGRILPHVYGKKGTDRLWSFSGVSDELLVPWGVDHRRRRGAEDDGRVDRRAWRRLGSSRSPMSSQPATASSIFWC